MQARRELHDRGVEVEKLRAVVLDVLFGFLSPLGQQMLRADAVPAGQIALSQQPIGRDAPAITARFRDPGGNVIGLYQQPG